MSKGPSPPKCPCVSMTLINQSPFLFHCSSHHVEHARRRNLQVVLQGHFYSPRLLVGYKQQATFFLGGGGRTNLECYFVF